MGEGRGGGGGGRGGVRRGAGDVGAQGISVSYMSYQSRGYSFETCLDTLTSIYTAHITHVWVEPPSLCGCDGGGDSGDWE